MTHARSLMFLLLPSQSLSSSDNDGMAQAIATASLERPVMQAAASLVAMLAWPRPRRSAASSRSPLRLSVPLLLSAAAAQSAISSSSPLRLSQSLLLAGAAGSELAWAWWVTVPMGTARQSPHSVVPGRDLGMAALHGRTVPANPEALCETMNWGPSDIHSHRTR